MVYTYNMRRVSAINIALLFVLMTCIAGESFVQLDIFKSSYNEEVEVLHGLYICLKPLLNREN